MLTASARSALDVVDWRRRVFALYAHVRAEPDPATAHSIWREGRNLLMAEHLASPLSPDDRASFDGLPVAAYRPQWRFEAPIAAAEPLAFDFESGTDGVVSFKRIGMVEIQDAGTLDVWRLTSYGGGVFIPVRDALAGRPGGTYGGGRYLLDTVKGADLGSNSDAGTLMIDFNFAYNPSCAYDPAWACPLAPPGNVLPAEVPVGEMYTPPVE